MVLHQLRWISLAIPALLVCGNAFLDVFIKPKRSRHLGAFPWMRFYGVYDVIHIVGRSPQRNLLRCQRIWNALHSLLMDLFEDATLFVRRFFCFSTVGLVLLLQACATTPPAGSDAVALEQESVPELTLNLPDQADSACACSTEEVVDHNLLDKGFRALASGDHREAVDYFRRYQRLDSSPGVDWEAEIAVAYDKMFPKSPYYNSKAASESYHRLKRQQPDGVELHEKILMMRDALATFVALHAKIDNQQDENDVLAENLEKREEALKRLRELTLGQ